MTYLELRHSLRTRNSADKFRYAYPLDRGIRRNLKGMALPYPTLDDLAEAQAG